MRKKLIYNIFISVRSQSSRLKNKCFLDFNGVTLIEHIINRSLYYGLEPILCTTRESSDDRLVKIANQKKIKYFRGSSKNKLLRWHDCCNKYKIDYFHSVDADDPFFDGTLIKKSLKKLIYKNFDIVFPSMYSRHGGATMGYSIKNNALAKILSKISKNKDTEMIEPFIKKYKKINFTNLDNDLIRTKGRFTLDYPEDYFFLLLLCKFLGNFASRKKIDNYLFNNKNLYKINWEKNKEWKLNQIKIINKNK